MVSYYSVAQYVPDEIVDERFNVGLIAWGAEGTILRGRDEESFARLQAYLNNDLTLLRSFLSTLAEAFTRPAEPEDVSPHEILNATLMHCLNEALQLSFVRNISFTPPRASLLDVQTTVDRMYPLFFPKG